VNNALHDAFGGKVVRRVVLLGSGGDMGAARRGLLQTGGSSHRDYHAWLDSSLMGMVGFALVIITLLCIVSSSPLRSSRRGTPPAPSPCIIPFCFHLRGCWCEPDRRVCDKLSECVEWNAGHHPVRQGQDGVRACASLPATDMPPTHHRLGPLGAYKPIARPAAQYGYTCEDWCVPKSLWSQLFRCCC